MSKKLDVDITEQNKLARKKSWITKHIWSAYKLLYPHLTTEESFVILNIIKRVELRSKEQYRIAIELLKMNRIRDRALARQSLIGKEDK